MNTKDTASSPRWSRPRAASIFGTFLAIAVLSPVAATLSTAGPVWAGSGGTFECLNAAAAGTPAKVIVDQAMAAGTSGSTGINYATHNNSTLSYCTLSGTVPAGWTVSLYGGTVLYVANGSTNQGTIDVGSEFDTFTQTGYSGSLLGSGSFTNDGTVALQEDPEDTTANGYIVGVEVPRFVNNGIFEIEPGLADKTGTASFGFQSRVAGAVNGLPPASGMTFSNRGTFSIGARTSVSFGSDLTPGVSVTFDNYGRFEEGATASVEWGQSNGSLCQGQHDEVFFAMEPGSSVDNAGSATMYCNGLDINGGSAQGHAIELVGATSAASVELVFGPGVAAPGHGAQVGGAVATSGTTLVGNIPPDWTIYSAGTLDVGAGTINRGHIRFAGGYNFSGPGRFVNAGTFAFIGAPGGNSDNVEVRSFVNSGTVTASGPGIVFGNKTPGMPLTVYNYGTIAVATGAGVQFGQSNGYYCLEERDPVTLVEEQSSTLDNNGSVDVFCNRVDINGGRVSGSQPLSLGGAQGVGSLTLSFAPGVSQRVVAGARIDIDDTTLAGTVPRGWALSVAQEVATSPGAANAGTLLMPGSSSLSGTTPFTNTGTLSLATASVTMPTLVNDGTLEVGPGPSSVTGNLAQGSRATLQVALDSSAAYSHLGISGGAHLGGTLAVTTARGFVPSGSFNVLDAKSVSGRFGTVRAVRPGPRHGYRCTYTSSGVYVHA
ncbi:MAG TPA: hypothetical protein VME46_26235 [Acidimicrobiales bacterium]|nr:hypothetical protein [Acidimicrobiales bacterium]